MKALTLPKRKTGAQCRKDTRTRTLRGGVWRLDIWQPHARVGRGKKETNRV